MSPIYNIFINIRAFSRFLLFVLIILGFFAVAILVYLINPNPIKRRKALTMVTHRTCKLILKTFSVELICKENIPENEGSLLIGNHIGFIDIVCLNALRNNVYITSLEMKNTPVLGQICDLGGCAYVNRKSRMNIQEELKNVVEVLKQGFRVVLYAESVASNGEQVLPFKKTLAMSAGLAGVPIRPFVFNFRAINGKPVSYELRDSVCWYGDTNFFEAIWKSLQLNSVTCEIEFLPLVYTKPEDDRTALANSLHKMVSDKYIPFYKGMSS